MFPIPLRTSKSDRSLHKLKKRKSFTWPTKSTKVNPLNPQIDFAAFHSGLANEQGPFQPVLSSQRTSPHHHSNKHPSQTSVRRVPRNVKRDTILLDLSNNDLIPALDYAFAILDADELSTRSLPQTPPPNMPSLSRGSSADSADTLRTPSTSTPSPVASPPRYFYVSSPLSRSPKSSSVPSPRPSPQKRRATSPSSHHDSSFDPQELSLALSQAASTPNLPSPMCDNAVPFPPPAPRPTTRVPLLLRKPRMHSAESSTDGHESLPCPSYPGSSMVSLARSVSSLDHHRDIFGARSTTSLHAPDPVLSALLARQPTTPRGSLRLFSSPKKFRPRASTPPPSRARLGIPTVRPPVPALPDAFLPNPAARREASSTMPSLLTRARSARIAM